MNVGKQGYGKFKEILFSVEVGPLSQEDNNVNNGIDKMGIFA